MAKIPIEGIMIKRPRNWATLIILGGSHEPSQPKNYGFSKL